MTRLADSIKSTRLLPEQCGMWYLGQEGFLLKQNDSYILVDPYLSDYVDRNCSQLVKWERLYPAPIDPSELDFIDLVICTHEHYDHADPETLAAIATASPAAHFVVPAPIVSALSSYGIAEDKIISARADEPIIYKGSKIFPIPSAHEELHRDRKSVV